MRNYIELNGKSSAEINGLLIQELPPVSKPKMRTRVEEIDGRAGDIITELGFKAYDKTIKIGLYGDFDLDDVISYFNSSGQVVFSNEPDKYYNYQIVDQIDYERLIRFRTAKVKMHVQPFKYPTEEEPLVGQYQYVSDTGSNLSLNNTANALFKKFDLKGNTSQTETPTPTSPIPVNVVSGDNYINICGKNLFNSANVVVGTKNGITCSLNSDGSIKLVGTATAYTPFDIPTTLSGTYTVSCDNWGSFTLYFQHSGGSANANKTLSGDVDNIVIGINNGVTINKSIKIQIEKGSTATTYEPYTGNSYPIYLGVENLWKNQLSGFLPTSGSYPTTNSSFPNAKYVIVPLLAGQKLTFSGSTSTSGRVRYIDKDTNLVLGSLDISTNDYYTTTASYGDGFKSGVITAKKDFLVGIMDLYSTNPDLIVNYGSTPQHISTTPIELCKIGTYQDKIYKENGNWYLHKEIGKVVLDGTINWALNQQATYVNQYLMSGTNLSEDVASGTANIMSDYFKYKQGNPTSSTNEDYMWLYQKKLVLDVRKTIVSDASGLKTWVGNNKPTIYYQLATPTDTLIEDTTLIEQLEEIKSANSYEGQTNIRHDSNDAPFLVDVSALQSGTDELVVDNEGNIYSRPTLDLEGTGIVNVYLEGNQMFQVDLTDTNEIVIDTDEMEAYNPTTQALMNRQVTGNYDNFKLNVGDNTLKFSGDLTKATVTNYVRWL